MLIISFYVKVYIYNILLVLPEARQIKTINYQLSSKRCLDEGWTLRCPSSLDMENEEAAAFAPDSTCPDLIHSGIVSFVKINIY